MNKLSIGFATAIEFVGVTILGFLMFSSIMNNNNEPVSTTTGPEVFLYTFNQPGTLQEAGDMDDSSSKYWWLDSGGKLEISDGSAKTNFNKMKSFEKWRLKYAISNPKDTDQGYYPQNIFRLVSRQQWRNFSEQAEFKLARYNVSDSVNRNESNGVLFFLRYQDGDNLYYAGIRVDGNAVIKKKLNGVYYTLALNKIFEGEYDRYKNPNLIPIGVWFGLKAEIITRNDNTVLIALYSDQNLDGEWIKVSEAVDSGSLNLIPNILSSGYVGVRGDFFDFSFRNFRVENF